MYCLPYTLYCDLHAYTTCRQQNQVSGELFTEISGIIFTAMMVLAVGIHF